MRIDIMTLFPEMCESVLSESIIGRARKNGYVEINCVNIRDFTLDKHNRVDDAPYGGGMGMLMGPQPIYDCYKSLYGDGEEKPHLIYMSPQGKTLTQQRVKELALTDRIVLLCGHYEGVDQRILDEIVDEEISIGDYVLTAASCLRLCLPTVFHVCSKMSCRMTKLRSLKVTITDFWNIRNIQDRTNGTGKRFPIYSCRGITRILISGDTKRHLRLH